MHNTDIEKSNQRRIIGIDESKYICCCGCHVISCAKFFSILSIVLSAITLLSSLFSSSYYLSADHLQIESTGNAFEPETFNSVSKVYSIVSCVIDIILNAGVLYGIYKIKPAALLPYIIVKIFYLIIFGLFIIIGLIMLALWVFIDNGPEIGLRIFVLIIVGAFVLGIFFIEYLFVHTFYRAYKYLKEVELRRYPMVYPMQNIPTYK